MYFTFMWKHWKHDRYFGSFSSNVTRRQIDPLDRIILLIPLIFVRINPPVYSFLWIHKCTCYSIAESENSAAITWMEWFWIMNDVISIKISKIVFHLVSHIWLSEVISIKISKIAFHLVSHIWLSEFISIKISKIAFHLVSLI